LPKFSLQVTILEFFNTIHPPAAISRAGARSRKGRGGFALVLKNSRRSGTDLVPDISLQPEKRLDKSD
jgi:hypothetical protein